MTRGLSGFCSLYEIKNNVQKLVEKPEKNIFSIFHMVELRSNSSLTTTKS